MVYILVAIPSPKTPERHTHQWSCWPLTASGLHPFQLFRFREQLSKSAASTTICPVGTFNLRGCYPRGVVAQESARRLGTDTRSSLFSIIQGLVITHVLHRVKEPISRASRCPLRFQSSSAVQRSLEGQLATSHFSSMKSCFNYRLISCSAGTV